MSTKACFISGSINGDADAGGFYVCQVRAQWKVKNSLHPVPQMFYMQASHIIMLQLDTVVTHTYNPSTSGGQGRRII